MLIYSGLLYPAPKLFHSVEAISMHYIVYTDFPIFLQTSRGDEEWNRYDGGGFAIACNQQMRGRPYNERISGIIVAF